MKELRLSVVSTCIGVFFSLLLFMEAVYFADLFYAISTIAAVCAIVKQERSLRMQKFYGVGLIAINLFLDYLTTA